jgi:dihydroorotate dehydrogenase
MKKGGTTVADISITVNGTEFNNPVLTAAGPNVGSDELIRKAIEGGAGGIVSKTVSVTPAKDPRPTIRKGKYGSLFNCETWSERDVNYFLPSYRYVCSRKVPLILSIGYSPDDVRHLGKLLEEEIDPRIMEFSTHYTGKSLKPLLDVARALRDTVSCPIWMKVSPGTPDIEDLAVQASSFVDGFVAINSLGPALDIDIEDPRPFLGSSYGQGWMSGPPVLPLALSTVYRIAAVQPKPVIGVGGISCGEDAIKFFMAGASLVQVCTAALRKGPGIYGKIAEEINSWLDLHGYSSLEDIRGLYRRNVGSRGMKNG